MSTDDKLALDYQTTLSHFAMLSDLRFKLLAFMPTTAGAAIVFLGSSTSARVEGLAIGLLGFLVTLGIVVYDLRNTTFYEASVHRARLLEARLSLPVLTLGQSSGGFFSEARGARSSVRIRFLWLVPVKHDVGLALVYGSSLAAWTYIIASAPAPLALLDSGLPALVPAVIVGLVAITNLIWLDATRPRPAPPAQPVNRPPETDASAS